MLERLGWEVDIAPDGMKAQALAQQNRYALVLMDCLMPEADGYTATAMIREHERTNGLPRLPIVALTANALSGDRERCLQAGMDDYLSKPLQLHLLKEVLERWVPAVRQHRCGSEGARAGVHGPLLRSRVAEAARSSGTGISGRIASAVRESARARYCACPSGHALPLFFDVLVILGVFVQFAVDPCRCSGVSAVHPGARGSEHGTGRSSLLCTYRVHQRRAAAKPQKKITRR